MTTNLSTTYRYCKECDSHYKILSSKNGELFFQSHFARKKQKYETLTSRKNWCKNKINKKFDYIYHKRIHVIISKTKRKVLPFSFK